MYSFEQRLVGRSNKQQQGRFVGGPDSHVEAYTSEALEQASKLVTDCTFIYTITMSGHEIDFKPPTHQTHRHP